MKKFIILGIVVLLAGFIATPVLAKNTKSQNKEKQAATYKNANNAQKAEMRATTLDKATKIQKKRTDSRHRVDDLMQERLKNIKADSPGNIGPIGG